MVSVIFTHDDEVGLWECEVRGAKSPLEAKQAFSAVVLTCHELNPELLGHTQVEEPHDSVYKITPAV